MSVFSFVFLPKRIDFIYCSVIMKAYGHKGGICMKFFHVYDERTNIGFEKHNLLNEDSGFKIQHVFSQPMAYKFNTIAAKGTKLHSIIKENKMPFYG